MSNDQTTNHEIKEIPVEERLRALYNLQKVVSQIDNIRTVRGELPLEVQDLEDEVAGLETRISKFTAEIEAFNEKISKRKNNIEESKLLIEKKENEKNNVRNNREFDALSKEIEYQNLEIELAEKDIKKYTAEITNRTSDIELAQERLAERKVDLEQKKSELNEIIAETRQEEDALLIRSKELEALIEPRLLEAFQRIRRNARNGLAVVTVERDACGGCFNKIPPQRQMDIRMRKKIIVCEYCGRILVDNEINNEL